VLVLGVGGGDLRHGSLRGGVQSGATYGLLWFALVPGGPIRRFNLIGDYSYGLYILCFPIQQTFVMLNPLVTPGWLLVSSFPAVLPWRSCRGTSSSTRP
jgi:peptidoglycan/LPS O-acetylase OafA/YrhL